MNAVMDDLVDVPESWPVVSHEVKATGRVQNFVEERVVTPTGDTMVRQWVGHPGAVGIMALDDQGRIAVVHQYRHPVGMRLVEPPAGILDMDGERAVEAAQRELAEEAQLAASDWSVLVDLFTSPGGLEESLRVYLARDLRPAPRPDGFVVADEETDMGLAWLPLDTLVERVYAGQVQNPTMVAGTLALALAIATGRVERLRPPTAPWPARTLKEARDRKGA
ncbi:NUDIX hydrolase [Brooklawnia cerclae]|uniref:ADP-ribose pyrophosphatase n=3 Tax=Bacteria TaxID=2 RepID=A0ABX0SDU3_9ACTN|nr:ADP-ribose pyrophosphatase [Brooklawnia cerclae]